MPLVPDFDRVPVCSGSKTYSYDANGNMLARADTAGKESIAIIDEALKFIAASNKRIARIEQRKGR